MNIKASASILLFALGTFAYMGQVDCSSKVEFMPMTRTYEFTLPPLPYSYNFLEPVLTSQILYAHHDHHHQSYTDKLNQYVTDNPELSDNTIVELLYLAKDDQTLQKHAGGYYNHLLYWWVMTNQHCSSEKPSGKLLEQIEKQWGSFEDFQSEFLDSEKSVFGSGWTWLCVNEEEELEIRNTKNQINPLMEVDEDICYPFFTNDIWEHAWYLKYMWDKATYFENYWKIVDWDLVSYFYENYSSKLEAIPL